MRIELNGRQVEVPAAATVAELVAQAGARGTKGVAVALDGEVVPRGAWEDTCVAEGQQVEVLEAIQGG
jgi:sulfur carrier protein